MRPHRYWLAIFLLGLTLPSFADSKNQKNKQDEAEIRAAQAKLEDAKRAASEAQKDASEARVHVAKVRSDLIALRRKIEDAAEGSKELKKAHERVDKLKASLAEAVAPILAELQPSPGYQAAAKQRDELRQQLKNLPQGPVPQRSALAQQVADAERDLRVLESAAIAKSPAAVKAQQALSEAEEKLRQALAEAEGALARDNRYAAAKRELDKAEQQAEAAAARAVAKQQAVASAQNKVQAEIAEERKEDQRERQQKNKKKK